MKAPPLLFGGWSPVVAYLRHSMMVFALSSVWSFCDFGARTHSLSRTIVTDDQGERCVELDGLATSIVKGTDSKAQDQ
jgi:hypothetical protein